MKHGYLSEYFTAVAAKTLSSVETNPEVSHQHELNGVAALREMLGTQRRRFAAHFMYLSDEEDTQVESDGTLTWYDSREQKPKRSPEWRGYYSKTPVSEAAASGDLIVIGRRPDDSLLIVIAAAGSTVANQVLWLFGLGEASPSFAVRSGLETDQDRLGYTSRVLLESLGVAIAVEVEGETFLDRMRAMFGERFPPTRAFSAFARETLPEVDPIADPDAALIAWLDREEDLFRTLEKHVVAERLEQGFANDVDGFIAYSLSVQNRRKSRAGRALENHLEHVFAENRIVYERNAVTERQSRPDFLFPDAQHYHDPAIDRELLTVLGAKSTCKDRWRQVLAEADRVLVKHLLTLEAGISVNQTDEMVAQRLQLVIPSALHDTFFPHQQALLLNVAAFLGWVRERQQALGN